MQRFSGGYNASEYYANAASQYNAPSSNMMLARAYIKNQDYIGITDPMKALYSGTVFKELDMPYTVKLR